jgi:hypothetical protein
MSPDETQGAPVLPGAPPAAEPNAGTPEGTPEGTQSAPVEAPAAVLPGAQAPQGTEGPTPEEEAEREQGAPAPAERATGVAPNGDVFNGDTEHPATNTFCRVIAGPYQGRYGVLQSTASISADGWPDRVVIRTRDAEDENIVVAYSDIRPDVAGRR